MQQTQHRNNFSTYLKHETCVDDTNILDHIPESFSPLFDSVIHNLRNGSFFSLGGISLNSHNVCDNDFKIVSDILGGNRQNDLDERPTATLPEAQLTEDFHAGPSDERVPPIPKPRKMRYRSISLSSNISNISNISELFFDSPILEPQLVKPYLLGLDRGISFKIPDGDQRAHAPFTKDVNCVSRAKSSDTKKSMSTAHPDTPCHPPAFCSNPQQSGPRNAYQSRNTYQSGYSLCINTHTDIEIKPIKRPRTPTPMSHIPTQPRRKRAARQRWTLKEDQRLRDAVKPGVNWGDIAALVQTRTANQCIQRWRNSVRPELAHVVKGTWSDQEDAQLRNLAGQVVARKRTIDWEAMASGMQWRRSPKQCRERWQNFLDPRLKIGQWTKAEDAKLMSLYENLGRQKKKWSKIAKQLPGRTSERIKRRHQIMIGGK